MICYMPIISAMNKLSIAKMQLNDLVISGKSNEIGERIFLLPERRGITLCEPIQKLFVIFVLGKGNDQHLRIILRIVIQTEKVDFFI